MLYASIYVEEDAPYSLGDGLDNEEEQLLHMNKLSKITISASTIGSKLASKTNFRPLHLHFWHRKNLNGVKCVIIRSNIFFECDLLIS